MSLVHHKVHSDGSVEHAHFSRQGWEAAMVDPEIGGHWGHPENDCHDPAARLWSGLRKEGRKLSEVQHGYADREDPTWLGNRSAAPPVRTVLAEPIVWPPEYELSVWTLCQLSTLCFDDAKKILSKPVVVVPLVPLKKINKVGQYSLF